MPSLLIVDDSTDLADMISQIYARRSILIIRAKHKAEVFSYLQNVTPNLILLDVLLEDEDGREICKEIKSTDKYKNIPIILMSGSAEKLINPDQVFADDTIEKPFNTETILSKVKKYFEKKTLVN